MGKGYEQVREQTSTDALNELSQEATVEHAEQAQHDLAEWLTVFSGILMDDTLEQLEEVSFDFTKELQNG